jgi:hypothetical protein
MKSWLRGYVTSLFGVLSVFGRRIKGMVRLRPEQVLTGSVTCQHHPLLAADIARAPVTNWERQCVTLAGYCYAVRHGMKVHLVTPYRVNLLQCYDVTIRGNIASDWHDTELRAELSSRASRRNSILRALHIGVPSLLREQRAVVTCHAARPHLLRP